MIRRFLFPFIAVLGLAFAPFASASDLTITAASVANVSANTNTGTAGATITAGQTLYLEASSNTLKLCDATNSAKYKCAGISLHGSLAGQPITYATGGGSISAGATLTVGATYYVSKTGGGLIMPTADIASTNYIFRLGFATTASNLVLDFKDYTVQAP
jgi:hypothetical protein